MEQFTCKDCKYYVQHYVKIKRQFVKAGVGHCTGPTMKERKIHSQICNSFEGVKKAPVE